MNGILTSSIRAISRRKDGRTLKGLLKYCNVLAGMHRRVYISC